jgi:hypothetical protein
MGSVEHRALCTLFATTAQRAKLMFFANRIRMTCAVLLYGCFIGLSPTASVPAWAGDSNSNAVPSYTTTIEGSTPAARATIDNANDTVTIYVGGSFPAGTKPLALQFLFDRTAGNPAGYITPLLFEHTSFEAFTIYTVRAIGKGFVVFLNSAPQTIPFVVLEGTKVTTNANFTFGFTTARVNSSGVPFLTSQGVVDFDTPSDGGQGVGGVGTTNDWLWKLDAGPPVTVALGTTFGLSGSNADYTLGLPYRSYSAQAVGLVVAQ